MKRNSPSPNHPYRYGSTKVGRDRFWWCVWDGSINMHVVLLPDAWGEAPTREAAETAAHAAAKGLHFFGPASLMPAKWVKDVGRRIVLARERECKAAATPGSGLTDSQSREYLYRSWGIHSVFRRHEIIKKTLKRIFVSAESDCGTDRGCTWELENFGPFGVKQLSLDRAKLERGESIRGFTLEPPVASEFEVKVQVQVELLECFATLGFREAPETVEAVDRQFRRLAKHHHPDKGGDAETFKKIHKAYDVATRQVLGV